MLFEKIADFIMKHAKIIIAIWIIALIISAPFLIRYNSVLQYDMDKMSTSTPLESVKGQEMLNSGEFSGSGNIGGGTVIIVEAYDSLAADIAPTIYSNLQNNVYFWDHNVELREKYGMDCEVTVTQLGRFDDKYFADKETQMIIYTVSFPELPDGTKVKNSNYIPDIREIVAASTDSMDGILGTYVTGTDAISYDTSTGATEDIKHIDPISILLVLVLIGLFFRSFVTAGTPPVIIGMAYGILLALVFAIGSVIGIYYITTILVLVSMLGAGCDYCIFIISRYREERKAGKDHDEALRESIIWAGESIITSGISVMIGFGSLMLCSFSLVSTMGLILALGILLALMAALTFIPSLLMLVGDRIFWPSTIETYKDGSKAMNGWYGKCAAFGQKYFTHSAKSAIKYAKVIVVVTILLTVPLAYVALSTNSSYDMIGAMPDGEAKEGVSIISENMGGGLLMPTNITMKVDAFADIDLDAFIESGGKVQAGSLVTFLAKPRTGYTVSEWVINGAEYTADGTYGNITISDMTECEINGISADTTINVVYSKISFPLTFSTEQVAGHEGSGTLTAEVNGNPVTNGTIINFADKLYFKATPDTGSHVDHWIITRNGESETYYSHDDEFSIDRASYVYDVKAVFSADDSTMYKVNYSVIGNGTVAVRADDSIIEGGSDVPARSHITISAMADDGYKVSKITINGTEYTNSFETIEFIEGNADISVEFIKYTPEKTHVYFANDGDGSVKATANGVEINSGDLVDEGSKVVFTASPSNGKKVIGWKYDNTLIPVTVYTSKTEQVITNLQSEQNITVIFGDPASWTVEITATPPVSNGSIEMREYNTVKQNGTYNKGVDMCFIAKPDEGYHVDHWVVNGSDIETPSKYLSLYDIDADTEVSYVAVPDSFVVIDYSVNDDSLGTIQVTCDKMGVPYSERPNASLIYSNLNMFSQSLMSMTTDGENNVALALGAINGDFLFDGEHEWLLDTIWNILPREYQAWFGSGLAYDALMYTWKYVLTYEMKESINYYIAYKAGFVSKVFEEDGKEYQYVKVMVVTKDEPMSELSVETIKQTYDMKDEFIRVNSAENGGFVYAGYLSGAAVSNYEMSEMVSKDFHFIVFVVIGLLILLLFVVMRSYLTPIRAVFTIVMSVLWTLGLTHLLFGTLLGMPVVWIVPIVLFVVCLGLGMDYDILLTTRIKEYVGKGYTNDEAIIAAVQKSGAVITLCGLIMAGAFGTMLMSTSPMLMEFGFALGFAIAVDALIIRTYIVPAIMHLMGDWNWKGPDFGKIFKKKTEE